MEQKDRVQYRPISFSKQFYINDVDQIVVIGLHLSSTSIQICAQDRCLTSPMNDSFRKSLTVRTVQVHELLRQNDTTSVESIEDALKAVVLEVYQDFVFAPYVEPFLSEEQTKRQVAFNQKAAEAATKREAARVPARREAERLKAKEQRGAQERERLRISKLTASNQEELRREKEVENYICGQIEDQATRVRASLDGSVAQNVSICITDVTGILELEIHISSKTFDEMLSNCRYHLKNCQSIQAIQDQHCLSHDWINQLRHECTNYDSIIANLKQQDRHTENIHKLVRFAVNHLTNTVWKQRMMILLEGDLYEAKAKILKLQEVKEAERQEKSRAERKRRIEAEQARIETERVQAEAQTRRRLEEQRLQDEQVEQERLPVKTTIFYPVVDLDFIEAERLRVEAERTRLNLEDTERSKTNLRRTLKEPESRSNLEKQKYSQEQLARQKEALEALYERKRLREEQDRKKQDTKEAQNKQAQLKQEQETHLAPTQRQVFGPSDFRTEEQKARLASTPSGEGCVVLLLALGISTVLVSKFSIFVLQWMVLLLHKAF